MYDQNTYVGLCCDIDKNIISNAIVSKISAHFTLDHKHQIEYNNDESKKVKSYNEDLINKKMKILKEKKHKNNDYDSEYE